MKSLIRWAGSKQKLLPTFLPIIDKIKYGSYIEPFAGSASLFFNLEPAKAVLSDINPELINCLSIVKSKPFDISERLEKLPHSKELYYELRSVDPNDLDEVDRASRFLYLNRFCFNGLYRTNLSGNFNVPWGGDRSGKLPTISQLMKYSECLQTAKIICDDFESVIENKLEKSDLVYLDPPYATSNRRIFKEYNEKTFKPIDLERIYNCLELISKRGAYFIFSYADVSEISVILEEWGCRKVEVQRNIAGFSGARKMSTEVIITNF